MKLYNILRQIYFPFILCLIGIFSTYFLYAQQSLPLHALQVNGGYSKHGSGDMNGVVFGSEYTHYLSKRLSLCYNFRGSIHHSADVILFRDIFGVQKDASIRFTTAGVQLGVNGQYSVIRNSNHELLTSLGAFGRYQSASNGSDGYSLYYPTTTNVPAILVGYDNQTPQQTYSLGAIVQLIYQFTFDNQIMVGFTPGFQTDTNGDVLLQVLLTAGRRF